RMLPAAAPALVSAAHPPVRWQAAAAVVSMRLPTNGVTALPAPSVLPTTAPRQSMDGMSAGVTATVPASPTAGMPTCPVVIPTAPAIWAGMVLCNQARALSSASRAPKVAAPQQYQQ